MKYAVRPGCVVADIDTGPGVMAILACQLGAGHVYAVEPNDAIQVGREVAAAHGFASRITFIQGLSTQWTPPQRCDVLISDLRGILPLYEQHLPSIIDARNRWLKPGGIQIPNRDIVRGALVESQRVYADYDCHWRSILPGVPFEAARRRTINGNGKCNLVGEELLSPPVVWRTLDYRIVTESNFTGAMDLIPERTGTAHGFACWFDAELVDGIGFSNAPGRPKLVYGQMFFPFTEPLAVQPGDRVAVDLSATLVNGEYLWRWTTSWSPADPARGEPITYRQSNFLGQTLSPETLQRRSNHHVPRLNVEGMIEKTALDLMNGQRTSGEIASHLATQFPQRFADQNQALGYVSDLAMRYAGEE